MKTMTAFKTPDMNTLHDKLADRLLWSSRDELSMTTSVDTQLHNVMVHADSMNWEFNFKNLWIGKNRWTAMANQYVDRDALDAFVDACGTKLVGRARGLALMRMKTVTGGHTSGGKTWRRWGGCMLAVGYRAMPWPQITLHSRTSYLGYIGAMDMTVVHAIAREISAATGTPVESMGFTWHIEAAQYHGFKSLAYVLANDDRREQFQAATDSLSDAELREQVPAVLMHKKWLANFDKEDAAGLLYGDMKFGQTRRIRKRMHTELYEIPQADNPYAGGDHSVKSQRNAFHPLPDLWASDLTLDHKSLKRRSGGDDAVEELVDLEAPDDAEELTG